MSDWLDMLSDEQLKERRDNLYFLTCWFDSTGDKAKYDDIMDRLRETDGEIEKRKTQK